VSSKKRPTRITQVLPEARIIPNIRFLSEHEAEKGIVATDKEVDRTVAENLSKIALEAYASARQKTVEDYEDRDEPIAVILAPMRAVHAVSHFVSEKAFETALPDFRRLVASKGKSSLKRAIIDLLQKIPTDVEPPFPQMRELCCSQNRKNDWDVRLSPARVRAALEQWVALMEQLHSQAGSGRTPLAAEANFVGELATYWTEELGAQLINSRAFSISPQEWRSSHAFEQKGLFADFIREAAKVIPEIYRPGSWDQAIRRIIETVAKKEKKQPKRGGAHCQKN
jgi:hypothetical protein